MDVLMVRSLMIKLYRKGLPIHSYSIFTVKISRPSMLIISTKALYKYLSSKSRSFLFFLKNRLSTRLRIVNPH